MADRPDREELLRLEAYGQVPPEVIEDLLVHAGQVDAAQAPGYLKAVHRIVMLRRNAKRRRS